MAGKFYQIDNEILKMYSEGRKVEAEFGLYISSRENLQRIKGDLPRGQFYMSVGCVCMDLEISRGKAQRIIDIYKKKGIIKLIHQYEKWKKKPSIWEVRSVLKSGIQSDIQNDMQDGIQEYSEINLLNGIDDIQGDTQINIQSDTSKKENLKRKLKNNIIVQEAEQLWKLYPYKIGKGKVIKKIPNLIKKYGFEQMKNTITRYIQYVDQKRNEGFKGLKYQNGSTFLNSGYVDFLDKNYVETIGTKKEHKPAAYNKCPTCGGKTVVRDEKLNQWVDCTECNGTGKVKEKEAEKIG